MAHCSVKIFSNYHGTTIIHTYSEGLSHGASFVDDYMQGKYLHTDMGKKKSEGHFYESVLKIEKDYVERRLEKYYNDILYKYSIGTMTREEYHDAYVADKEELKKKFLKEWKEEAEKKGSEIDKKIQESKSSKKFKNIPSYVESGWTDNTVYRARRQLDELLFNGLMRYSSFVTLTYDNEHLPATFEDMLKDLQQFERKIRKGVANDIKIIAAPERGAGNGRFHWHVIATSDTSLWRAKFEKCWDKGFLHSKPIKKYSKNGNVQALTRYILKYITKQNARQKGQSRTFFASHEWAKEYLRAYIPPEEIEELLDFLKEHIDEKRIHAFEIERLKCAWAFVMRKKVHISGRVMDLILEFARKRGWSRCWRKRGAETTMYHDYKKLQEALFVCRFRPFQSEEYNENREKLIKWASNVDGIANPTEYIDKLLEKQRIWECLFDATMVFSEGVVEGLQSFRISYKQFARDFAHGYKEPKKDENYIGKLAAEALTAASLDDIVYDEYDDEIPF